MNRQPIRPPSSDPKDIQRFCIEASRRMSELELQESQTIAVIPLLTGTMANVKQKPSSGGSSGDARWS